MTGSLPIIGVQAAILGMAAFNANSRTVESQLAAMGVAASRLERSSSASFDGVIGSLQNVTNAHKQAANQVVSATTAQAEAINKAALATQHAEDSVIAASAKAASAIEAANARIEASSLERATVISRSLDAIQAAETARAEATNVVSVNTIAHFAREGEAATARAATVIAANEAETTSFWKMDAAATAAAAAAKVRALETASNIAPGSIVSGVAHPELIQARKDLAAADALAAQAAELDALAQTHLNEVNAASVAANQAVVAAVKQVEVAYAQEIVAIEAVTAAQEKSFAQREAAEATLAATATAAAAAITAAEAEEAAAYTAAGIAITAAEAEVTAATQAAAAAQVAANAEVIASAKSLALVAGGALLGLALGLAAAGAAALTVGVKYEQALAFTGALTEATTAQIKELGDAQLELSRRSTLSAGELNKISSELGKAGTSIKDILGGVLQATNDLVVASAGELKAADAASLMQVAMTNFRATAIDTANSTTAAVQRSTLSFTDFAVAMRQGGGAAANFGLDIKEFSAAIGVMGATIKSGSEAGTGLRMVFQRLQNPSKEATAILNETKVSLFDAAGAARPFRDIINNLSEAYGDNAVKAGKMTEQQRQHDMAVVFGAKGGKAAIALTREGIAAYDDMLAAINRLKASDLAQQLLLPTGAQLKIIGNNITAIGIAFSEGLTPYVNKAVSSMLAWMQTIDLKQVTAFGEAVGVTLYNAFANLGNLLDAKITPSFSLAQAIGVAAITAISLALLNTLYPAMAVIAGYMVTWAFSMGAYLAALGVAWAAMAAEAAVAAAAIIASAGLPVLAMVGAVAAAAALLVVAWQNNWGNIQEVVGTAVANMTKTLGSFFEWALKKFGDLLEQGDAPRQEGDVRKKYGGAGVLANLQNDPVVKFFKDIPKLAGDAGSAVSAFIEDAKKGLAALKDFKMPDSHDFAADVKKAWDASAEARDKALSAADRVKLIPTEETDPGLYPPKGKASTKVADAIKAARELARDFNDRITKETGIAANSIANLYVKAYERVAQEIDKAQKAVDKATSDATAKITELDTSRAQEQDQEARKKALNQRLEDEKRANDRSLKLDETAHHRTLEDADKQYDKERHAREKAFDDVAKIADQARSLERSAEDKAYSQSQRGLIDVLGEQQKVVYNTLKKRYTDKEDALKAEQVLQDKALKDQNTRESETLKLHNEDIKRTLKEAQVNQNRALKDQQELQAIGLKAKIDAENAAIKDQHEAIAAALKHQQAAREAALKVEQSQREAALKIQLDAADTARKREQDATDRALKDKLEAESAAFKASQTQRENLLKKQLDAEKTARENKRALADIDEKDARERAIAQAEYSKEIGLGTKQSIAQARLNEKLGKITTETGTARATLVDRQADRSSAAEFEAGQQAKLDALKAGFDKENIARTDQLEANAAAARYKREDEDTVHKAANEAKTAALKTAFAKQELDLKAVFEKQDLDQKTAFELADALRKIELAKRELAQKEAFEAQTFALEKTHANETIALDAEVEAKVIALRKTHEDAVYELNRKQTVATLALRAEAAKQETDLKAEQDKKADDYKTTLENEALARSQARKREDLLFSEAQDKVKRANTEAEDAAALVRKRANEDIEHQYKLALDDEAVKYHRTQTDEKEKLEKQFDAEEYDRKIKKIYDIRDASIEATRAQLAEEQDKTRVKLAEDVLDLLDHLKVKTDAVKAEYVDKLGDILEKGGPALQGLVDKITSDINSSINSMTEVTKDLTDSLIEAFSAEQALARVSAERVNAKSNAKNDTPAPSTPEHLTPGAVLNARPRNADGTIAGVETPRKPDGTIDWDKINSGRGAGGPKIVGGDVSSASQDALNKASRNINSSMWNGWCAKFVANMFGKDAAGGDAWQVNARTITNKDRNAPRGTIVGFRRDPSNGGFGHIGISEGGGNFISATTTGVQTHNFNTEPYWANLYQGWGPPKFQKGVTDFQGGLAYVHQGELLVNLPKGTDVINSNTLASVRAAEAMHQRGNTSNSQTTNHYQYSVEANYGNVQPEGSIQRDLSALVAMTKR